MITSGKGGSGKSTLAAALGRALSAHGHSVALIDMDMGMRSLDLMLGVQDRVVYDLGDVADGTVKLRPALVKVDPARELYLLSASALRGDAAIVPDQAMRIAATLKDKFDLVLIDCPAGVGRGFQNAIAGADRAIVVALPDRVSLRDAERVAALLSRAGMADAMLVLNRVPMDAPMPDGLSVDAIRDSLRLRFLGWVPDDPGIPLGRGVRQTGDIAKRLMGQDVPIENHRRRGYFARLGRALAGR